MKNKNTVRALYIVGVIIVTVGAVLKLQAKPSGDYVLLSGALIEAVAFCMMLWQNRLKRA